MLFPTLDKNGSRIQLRKIKQNPSEIFTAGVGESLTVITSLMQTLRTLANLALPLLQMPSGNNFEPFALSLFQYSFLGKITKPFYNNVMCDLFPLYVGLQKTKTQTC